MIKGKLNNFEKIYIPPITDKVDNTAENSTYAEKLQSTEGNFVKNIYMKNVRKAHGIAKSHSMNPSIVSLNSLPVFSLISIIISIIIIIGIISVSL